MKRSELEKYLGCKVGVILQNANASAAVGYLKKSDPSNINVPMKNYYFTTDTKESNRPNGIVFRCSYVTRCKAI